MIGDVAQRVERLLRMQEAGGSNPPISTNAYLDLIKAIHSIILPKECPWEQFAK